MMMSNCRRNGLMTSTSWRRCKNKKVWIPSTKTKKSLTWLKA
jgi:hypothetical protein